MVGTLVALVLLVAGSSGASPTSGTASATGTSGSAPRSASAPASTPASTPASAPAAAPAAALSTASTSVPTPPLQLTRVGFPGKPSALIALSSRTWVVAVDHQLFRTTDGGAIWQPLLGHCAKSQRAGSPCGNTVTGFAALGPTLVAVAAGLADVWRSGDGGRTWHQVLLPAPVVDGPWSAEGRLWLATQPGSSTTHPLRTPVSIEASAGGQRWSVLGRVPPEQGGYVNFAGVQVLGDGEWSAGYWDGDCTIPAGLAFSTDEGRSWKTVPSPSPHGEVLGALGRRLLFAVPPCIVTAPPVLQGLFESSDAGSSWQAARLVAGSGPLLPGEVHMRTLQGEASRSQPSQGSAASGSGTEVSVDAIATAGARSAVAVGGYGTYRYSPGGFVQPASMRTLVLVTSDGGATWRLDSLPSGPELDVVSCASPRFCIAGSSTSTVGVVLVPGAGKT